jgi:hypothetical protein
MNSRYVCLEMNTTWGAVFVCQGGGLEQKAAVLAASLRRQNGSAPRLVAAIPGPATQWPRPAERTIAYLESLDVQIVETENPIGDHYPIGNKFGCLSVMPDVDRCFILDSDLLSLAPILPTDVPSAALAVKPEDRPGPWIDRDSWRQLYRWAGMPRWQRSEEITTTVSRHRMPPYFNAGVVALDPATGIGERWVEWSRRIDPATEIRYRHPWLDQVALPIAARSIGVEPAHLDESWNYPAHHWLLREPVRFAHYHEPTVIEEDPLLWRGLRDLVAEDVELRAILDQDETWRRIIRREEPIPRSQFVLLAAQPNSDVSGALDSFAQLGFASLKLDLPFVKRVSVESDLTWVATWLRKKWLEHDSARGPLVMWDNTSLWRHADAVFNSIDGYSIVVVEQGRTSMSTRIRALSDHGLLAPRLRSASIESQHELKHWLERADLAEPVARQGDGVGRARRMWLRDSRHKVRRNGAAKSVKSALRFLIPPRMRGSLLGAALFSRRSLHRTTRSED